MIGVIKLVKLPLYSTYLIYTAVLGLIMTVIVPRRQIKRLAFWGLIYGSVVDFLILILYNVFSIGKYKNYGPFAFMGFPFFPLLAWAFYFIIYLYFLPKPRPFNYVYSIAAAGYCTIFSNILQNLHIFRWHYGRLVLPFIIYLLWNLAVTWTYQRFFQDKKL
jgi:hypothetical protein